MLNLKKVVSHNEDNLQQKCLSLKNSRTKCLFINKEIIKLNYGKHTYLCFKNNEKELVVKNNSGVKITANIDAAGEIIPIDNQDDSPYIKRLLEALAVSLEVKDILLIEFIIFRESNEVMSICSIGFSRKVFLL